MKHPATYPVCYARLPLQPMTTAPSTTPAFVARFLVRHTWGCAGVTVSFFSWHLTCQKMLDSIKISMFPNIGSHWLAFLERQVLTADVSECTLTL
jgi:hypothetical protein